MQKTLYWLLSLAITLSFAVFQRLTGPTYPVKGARTLEGGTPVSFRLPRSCAIAQGGCLIRIKSPEAINGYVSWRRFKSADAWTGAEMKYSGGFLSALLPDQPPAGKLEYRVFIGREKGALELSGAPVVVRFKGAVPASILVPHVLFMFLFMLFSVRIFIAAVARDVFVRRAVALNLLFLLLGGFVFGPLTQFHAFGAYWTGWPSGGDLTDNKTLVMLAFWLAAAFAVFKTKNSRPWLLAAFAVTALLYLVPHSMFGSELDYSKAEGASPPVISHAP